MTEALMDSNSSLAQEGRRICDESSRRGLTLRLFGGVAFYLRASDPSLFGALGRDPMRDLDFVGLSEERPAYKQLFKELGYEIDQDLLVAGEGRRFLFRGAGATPVEVDLFIDRLQMCHTLQLRRRVTLDPETLPPIDLLLQKLQIVDLNRKDMIDVVVLVGDHEIGTQGVQAIDTEHAVSLLSDDWGFYYTAMRNVDQIKQFVATTPMQADARETVDGRLDQFAAAVEDAPKTRKWRLRAKVGTRKKWYQDVEEDIVAF